MKFGRLYEGTATQGNPTLLNEIYTELYITESESGEISNEHEVRQIETQSRRAATEDTAIKCNDIFRPLPGQDKDIRTVLTKGVAGIGKNSLCAEVDPGLGRRERESGRPAHISTAFQRNQPDEGQNTQSFRSSSCLFP